MRAGPAVVDTNVVVSGVLSESGSPTARILDGMLRGRFQFLLSLELLAEYRAVLIRPRIRTRHKLADDEIETVLTAIAASATVVDERRLGPRSSGGDGHLWQLMDAEPRALLATGDRLFEAADYRGRVVLPRAFADDLLP